MNSCMLETLEPRVLLSGDPSGRPAPTDGGIPSASVFLALSATSAAYASDVNLVAHVVTTGGRSANGMTLDFIDQLPTGDVTVGSAVVTNSAATLTWNGGAVGTHHLVAQLEAGTALNASASAPQDLTVSPATVLVSVTEGGAGVTATVTSDFVPVTTGTVTFFEGRKVLKTIQLSENGTATLPPMFRSGAHDIVAAYNGAMDYKPNTSHAFTVVVGGSTPPPSVIKIGGGYASLVSFNGDSSASPTALRNAIVHALRRRTSFAAQSPFIVLPMATFKMHF